MQVSSVTLPNGRIRSAIPLDESKMQTHTNGLRKLTESRRVEMEREESVHDDLVFEYSSRYREFSGRVRKSQAITSIQSSDEDDHKENRQTRSKSERNDFQQDLPNIKTKKSELNKKKYSDDEIDQSENEKVLGEITSRSKNETNNMRGKVFLEFF